MRTAVFTIISKNYLAFARTLLSSVEKVHPEWERYLLLVDEKEINLISRRDRFSLVDISEIALPDVNKMKFRYTVLELNTAVKPWMFYWLFNNKKYDHVVYLDPDIYVYEKMTEVEEYLNYGKFMVLTPHLTGFLEDGKMPGELDIMRSGIYNLGFLALSKSKDTNMFLDWWKSKLEYECVVDLEKGLFVDQKWMDFAPGMFDNVAILRHSGYNVAYWNLKHRSVKVENSKYFFNNERLVFFHFSGVNPDNPHQFSKHQDRYNISSIGPVAHLLSEYIDEVKRNGYNECKNFKYSFNYFTNGIEVNEFCRKCYRKNKLLINLCGENPFEKIDVFIYEPVRHSDNEKGLPLVTWVMYEIWNSRSDLKNAFPDIFGTDRIGFCHWYIESVQREYGMNSAFINAIKDSLIKYDNEIHGKDVKNVNQCKISISTKFRATVAKSLYRIGVFLKPIIRTFISKKTKEKLQKLQYSLLKEAYTSDNKSHINNTPMINKSTLKGVNLVGYVRAETGIGESSRSAARALYACNIPFGIINFEIGNVASKNDMSWSHKETSSFKYNVNLYHINADQMMVARDFIPNENWINKYNIGYWAWELPEFPDDWMDSFKVVNEVWVPSNFVLDSVKKKSTVPVIRIPHSIDVRCNNAINRTYFKLPQKSFLFLSMYDVNSIQERKNPQAAIVAFKQSFRSDDESVGLVIKINHSDSNPQEVRRLINLVNDYKNIYLIDKILSREEVNALINISDSFISLHRSEGFGLVLAEAMFLGKAVIGTNWSGNIDFMNKDNSCIVDYKLINLGKDYGPYKAHQQWAEPDIENACYYMKKLVNNEQYYNTIALCGQQTIKNEYSPFAVGNMIKERLNVLGLL